MRTLRNMIDFLKGKTDKVVEDIKRMPKVNPRGVNKVSEDSIATISIEEIQRTLKEDVNTVYPWHPDKRTADSTAQGNLDTNGREKISPPGADRTTHSGTTEAETALEMTTQTSGRLTNTNTMPENLGTTSSSSTA